MRKCEKSRELSTVFIQLVASQLAYLPKTIALFYKTKCQSILQYGIDIMPICKTKLQEDIISLSHKSTLRINEQIKLNHTTSKLYNHLREYYRKYTPLKESFFKKLNKTIVECRINLNTTTLKEQIQTAMQTIK
jgi:hypothetical protein